jgi:hypothetical protein
MSHFAANKNSVAATSGDVAAATAAASLPATPGVTNYIAGFSVHGSGATAAAVVQVTLTGIGITMTFSYAAVAGATLINQPLDIIFEPPIPATGQNTAITVSCPSLGSGALHNAVNVWGYQQ